MSQDSYAYITVRVTPKSGRDELYGRKTFEDGVEAVCVRVSAPPDKGKANKAVCVLVAQALDIPKTSVELVSGQTARRKRLRVELSQERVDAWVASLSLLD